MNLLDSEAGSIELAANWMKQFRVCLELMKVQSMANPEEARCLLQPAMDLTKELAAAQATLHALTEHIHSAVDVPSYSN